MFDQQIQEFITCHGLEIGSCITDGGSKQETMFFHQIHGCKNFVENTCTTAAVIYFLKAFQ